MSTSSLWQGIIKINMAPRRDLITDDVKELPGKHPTGSWCSRYDRFRANIPRST